MSLCKTATRVLGVKGPCEINLALEPMSAYMASGKEMQTV